MQIRLDFPCGQTPGVLSVNVKAIMLSGWRGVAITAGSVDRDALAAETSVGHLGHDW